MKTKKLPVDDEPFKVVSDIGGFGIVPRWIFFHGLSARAVALYCLLSVEMNTSGPEEEMPRIDELAPRLGLGRDATQSALVELDQCGCLKKYGNSYIVNHTKPRKATN